MVLKTSKKSQEEIEQQKAEARKQQRLDRVKHHAYMSSRAVKGVLTSLRYLQGEGLNTGNAERLLRQLESEIVRLVTEEARR